MAGFMLTAGRAGGTAYEPRKVIGEGTCKYPWKSGPRRLLVRSRGMSTAIIMVSASVHLMSNSVEQVNRSWRSSVCSNDIISPAKLRLYKFYCTVHSLTGESAKCPVECHDSKRQHNRSIRCPGINQPSASRLSLGRTRRRIGCRWMTICRVNSFTSGQLYKGGDRSTIREQGKGEGGEGGDGQGRAKQGKGTKGHECSIVSIFHDMPVQPTKSPVLA